MAPERPVMYLVIPDPTTTILLLLLLLLLRRETGHTSAQRLGQWLHSFGYRLKNPLSQCRTMSVVRLVPVVYVTRHGRRAGSIFVITILR